MPQIMKTYGRHFGLNNKLSKLSGNIIWLQGPSVRPAADVLGIMVFIAEGGLVSGLLGRKGQQIFLHIGKQRHST